MINIKSWFSWMMMFRFLIYQENQLRGPGSSTSRAWRKLGETEDFGRKMAKNTSLHVTFHDMFIWNVHKMFMKCIYDMFIWNVPMKCSCQLYLCPLCCPVSTHSPAPKVELVDMLPTESRSTMLPWSMASVAKLLASVHKLRRALEKSWVCLQTGYPATKKSWFIILSVLVMFRITIIPSNTMI